MQNEQGVLRVSIIATVLVAGFGIAFGILSRSSSITFDGVYALADAGMTVLALSVSSLIAKSAQNDALSRRLGNRFTMGFWHLEPMVLGMQGTLLFAVAIYALINAIISILNGGHHLEFGFAIVYAVVTLVACVAMAAFGTRANRRLQSDFVALDVRSWIMSGGITAALLLAFLIGYAADQAGHEWLSPYIDPVALAIVSLVIIPMPIGTMRQALADVLLIAPADLKAHVDQVAGDVVSRLGFLSYRAYVAKVGRAIQVELYFIAPQNWPAKSLEEWDHIRDEIGEAIGGESSDRWLTIAFTTDPEWAE